MAVELLDRYRQPVLVETFLPGREFTVGIVGTGKAARAIGSIEIVLRSDAEPDVYSYTNKEECEKLVDYRHVTRADPLVAEAERIALDAWIALDCRDGGRVDIRCDASRQTDVPRGQSARRFAPDALRSADDRHRHRHAVRGTDPRHRRLGRETNSESARPRRLDLMHILLLHDAVSPTARPDAQDTLIQAGAVREALAELGHTPEVLAVADDLGALSKRLIASAARRSSSISSNRSRDPMPPPSRCRRCSTASASATPDRAPRAPRCRTTNALRKTS